MGNPIRGFPTKKQSHRTVFSPPPAFFNEKGDFALCGARHGDAVPVTPASLCKGLTETFIIFATSFSTCKKKRTPAYSEVRFLVMNYQCQSIVNCQFCSIHRYFYKYCLYHNPRRELYRLNKRERPNGSIWVRKAYSV